MTRSDLLPKKDTHCGEENRSTEEQGYTQRGCGEATVVFEVGSGLDQVGSGEGRKTWMGRWRGARGDGWRDRVLKLRSVF